MSVAERAYSIFTRSHAHACRARCSRRWDILPWIGLLHQMLPPGVTTHFEPVPAPHCAFISHSFFFPSSLTTTKKDRKKKTTKRCRFPYLMCVWSRSSHSCVCFKIKASRNPLIFLKQGSYCERDSGSHSIFCSNFNRTTGADQSEASY